jgi:hypothetical protein
MASVAIIGLDSPFAVFARVIAIVTAKTPRPVSMTNVVWIDTPIGFHLGEKIIRVNLLNHGDGLPQTWTLRITGGKKRGNAALGLGAGFVGACQGVNRVCFDPGH